MIIKKYSYTHVLLVFLAFQCFIVTRKCYAQDLYDYTSGMLTLKNTMNKRGLIYFDKYDHGFVKFRMNRLAEIEKYKVFEVKEISTNGDDFVVLDEVYYELPSGNIEKSVMNFVQVLDTGSLTLYKHHTYCKAFNKDPKGDNIFLTIKLDNYLIKTDNSKTPFVVRKKSYKKFKHQMLKFFINYPTLIEEINKNVYSWENTLLLVQKFNLLKQIMTEDQNDQTDNDHTQLSD